jgi:uncharacterized phage infection (PIP) family protein YhgE
MQVTPEQLEQLIKINKQLKSQLAAAQVKSQQLKAELQQCTGAVRQVFDNILDEKGRLSVNKAMRLMTDYSKIEQPIVQLMEIVEKHG